MNAPLRVTPGEARGLEILDMILAGRQVRIAAEVPTQLRAEVVAVGAERMLLTCMRMLVTEGGRNQQTVIREGRRVRGRIWDPGVLDSLKLEFTQATHDLWMGLCRDLETFSRGGLEVGGGALRSAARVIRKVVRTRETASGDWVVYALLLLHLPRTPISDELQREFRRRICAGSPLARLLALADPEARSLGRTEERLAGLLAPANSPMLTCLGDRLVDTWTGVVTDLWKTSDGGNFRVGCAMADRMLQGYLRALRSHGRLDLATPLMRLLATIVSEIMPGTPDHERGRTLALHPPASMAERDETLRAARRLLDFTPTLADLRQQLGQQRYGDPGYEQAQVFLRDAEIFLDPYFTRAEALRVGLGGALR